MFENIGSKIKTLAKVICWLGIIGSCLSGISVAIAIIELDDDFAFLGFFGGIVLAAVGSLFSWLGTLALYGLGQLIDNTDILVSQGRHKMVPPPFPQGGNYVPVNPQYANGFNQPPIQPQPPVQPQQNAPAQPQYRANPYVPNNNPVNPVTPVTPVTPPVTPAQEDVTIKM